MQLSSWCTIVFVLIKKAALFKLTFSSNTLLTRLALLEFVHHTHASKDLEYSAWVYWMTGMVILWHFLYISGNKRERERLLLLCFHWTEKSIVNIPENIPSCSTEERKSQGFATTWGWVNDDNFHLCLNYSFNRLSKLAYYSHLP